MSDEPDELKPVVNRRREQPRGAIDYFTWMCGPPGGGPLTVRKLVRMVEELRVAVPPDAYVQLSGEQLWANWQREV